MKKKLIIILFLVSIKGFSQSNNVQSAGNSFKSYENASASNRLREITDAKKFIDLAAENSSTANDPKMWYYRGKVYLAIQSDSSSVIRQLDADAAEKAAVSFVNCLKTDSKNYYTVDANGLVWLSAVGLFNRGVEAYNKDDFERAAKFYTDIFEIIPLDKSNNLKRNNITADVLNLNLYLVYKKSKDAEKAKMYLQKLMDAKYNDPMIYLYMSRIYLEQKDTVKALNYVEQGRKLFEENPNLINEEINLYMAQGKTDVLIDKLNEAIMTNPDNEQLYFLRGTLFNNKNEYEKAIADYKKATELKPDYFDANYNLGAVYFNQAAQLAKAANNIPPNKAKEYDEAKTKADSKFKEAQPYLEEAFRINPKDLSTIESLKQLDARIGDTKKTEEMKKLLDELKK